MSEYEAHVKTRFVEFVLHFIDRADLEKKVAELPDFAKIIEEKLQGTFETMHERIIDEFAYLYTIDSNGLVKLLAFPKDKTNLIRLALFLSSSPLSRDEIRQITGVNNPKAYMGHQDLMTNPDGTYSLNSEGRQEVVKKIIPAIRSTFPKKASE